VAAPTLITVQGRYVKLDGTPEKGSIQFTSSVFSLDSDTDTVMVPSTISATLDNTGSVSVALPATDDPDWTPVGWTYLFTAQFSKSFYSFEVVIPHNAPDGILLISELVPAQNANSQLYATYSHTHAQYVSESEIGAVVGEAVENELANYSPITHSHPSLYAALMHTHTAAQIVSGFIDIARLPVGLTSNTVAAGNHTHADLYVPIADFDSTLADYVLASDLSTTLNAYATDADVTTTLADYVLSAGLATTLSSYVTENDLSAALDDYTTASDLSTALSGKANTSHTHAISDVLNLQSTLDSKQAAGDYSTVAQMQSGDAAVLYTASVAYDASVAATNAVNTKVSKSGDSISGDLEIKAGDNSKGYRLRPTGGALDFEFGGAEFWLAGKSGSPGDPYGGDQHVVLKLRPNQDLVTAVGVWEYTDGPYGGARHLIDGTNGVASLGSKNGLTNLRFAGYKDTPGAPTTDTWATGDMIMDSNKVWWRCSSGGSPGTWT